METPKREEKLNIRTIHEKIEQGTLTYVGLLEGFLDQIKAHNEQVNAISELNPKALETAKDLDLEFQTKGRRSLLHGIPVVIKDNINVIEGGMATSGGAVAFEDHIASYDATIVTKLKKAGAIILGKTNLSEFANFISENSPNGFSTLKGQVKNPYGSFDVGGSSSGSAVSVACGFCQVAIGTETSGSIISPAAANSIIGLKPSLGLVSRRGVMPISASQDVVGPMAYFLDDVVIVQSIIEGFDPDDISTIVYNELGERNYGDYKQLLDHDALRLGIYINEEDAFERNASNKVLKQCINHLKARHIHIEKLRFDPKDYTVDWDVLYYEFPITMACYLAKEKGVAVKNVEDLVRLHESDLKRYVPYDQRQFKTAIKKKYDYEEDYSRALFDSHRYGRLIDKWMMEHQLDAVCYVDCDGVDIAARNGLPSLTFPIGYTDEGKPVGFTMTSKLFDEDKLFTLAYTLMPLIERHRKVEFGENE